MRHLKKLNEREITAYHGSMKNFKKFSTDKIYSGVGGADYGWGIYFTDNEKIATRYAIHANKTKMRLYTSELGDKLGKDIEEIFGYHSPFRNVASGINMYYDYYKEGVLEEKLRMYFGANADHSALIELLEPYFERITQLKANNVLYTVKLYKGRDVGSYELLDWDMVLPKSQRERIHRQREEEGLTFSDISRGECGGDVYYRIAGEAFRIDPSDLRAPAYKETSLFLLRAGIDGIKYQQEPEDEHHNYVIFDESQVEITDKRDANI
jgi:hypothetical protein